MSTYHRLFIGTESLPRHLSDFDVEQFFRLLPEDVVAIRERFRADRRLGPALQLLFLRASGRPLDRFAAVPKALQRADKLANTTGPLQAVSKQCDVLSRLIGQRPSKRLSTVRSGSSATNRTKNSNA